MASTGTELRVGIFVASALAIAATLVFTIGGETNLFASQTEYYTLFDSVGGLRSGSPVRVAGVSVGTVDDVSLQPDGQIRVTLSVNDSARHLIRRGSVASIGSKGLLGDMLVDIDVGQGDPLEAGSQVESVQAVGLADYAKHAGRVLGELEATAHHMAVATAPLGDAEFGRDIRVLTQNLTQLSETLVEGRGPVGELIRNERMASDLQQTLADARQAMQALSAAASDVQSITSEVRQGDGLAHALVYDEAGTKVLRSVADATAELAVILNDVRTNEGAIHNLVYEDETGNLIENLTAVSADLRAITQTVREGKGTMGGLLVDPSLYEDLKRLVGDVQRNKILRSLVRYSIQQSETPAAPQPPQVSAER